MNGSGTHTRQRNALIQGASRGIGLEMVRQLADRPDTARVFASCRAPASASELKDIAAATGRVTAVALDVTRDDSIAAAAAAVALETDRLDLVVNCAGLLHSGRQQPERRLTEVTADNLVRSFQVNAFGPILIARHFESLLCSSPQAVFASLSARVGSIGDNRLGGWYSYRAAKAAQNMFTKTLAIEWARRTRPIICLGLHPGTVATDLSAPFRTRTDPGKVFSAELAARQLLRIIDRASIEDSGHFIAWDGSTVPW